MYIYQYWWLTGEREPPLNPQIQRQSFHFLFWWRAERERALVWLVNGKAFKTQDKERQGPADITQAFGKWKMQDDPLPRTASKTSTRIYSLPSDSQDVNSCDRAKLRRQNKTPRTRTSASSEESSEIHLVYEASPFPHVHGHSGTFIQYEFMSILKIFMGPVVGLASSSKKNLPSAPINNHGSGLSGSWCHPGSRRTLKGRSRLQYTAESDRWSWIMPR